MGRLDTPPTGTNITNTNVTRATRAIPTLASAHGTARATERTSA